MDDLIAKLNALKGQTIDDATIASLLSDGGAKFAKEGSSAQNQPSFHPNREFVGSVDDLVVASRAAELELDSIRRYFQRSGPTSKQGIDGLADEDLSLDSDDDILADVNSSKISNLDKILASNSMIAIPDDEGISNPLEESLISFPTIDTEVSSIPQSVIISHGARVVELGEVQSMVDGMLVIGYAPLDQIDITSSHNRNEPSPAVCDVESLVFISGSSPLTVIGMVVDTLGTVYYPFHLVVLTNKDALSAKEIIGLPVCTISTHARLIEIDDVGGNVVIRGAPQICDYDDGFDDGADEADD